MNDDDDDLRTHFKILKYNNIMLNADLENNVLPHLVGKTH